MADENPKPIPFWEVDYRKVDENHKAFCDVRWEARKRYLRLWRGDAPPEDVEYYAPWPNEPPEKNPFPELPVIYGYIAHEGYMESSGRLFNGEPCPWEKANHEAWYAFADRVFSGPARESDADIVKNATAAYAKVAGGSIPDSPEHWEAAYFAIRVKFHNGGSLSARSRLQWKGFLPCILLLLSLLIPTKSLAADPPRPNWHLDAKISYLVLGPTASRATGGIMPSVTGRHSLPLKSTSTSLALGADIGLFGLSNDSQWIGVLGGPVAGIESRPFSIPLSFELLFRLDMGRIPLCNRWGLCARYLGFFPASELGVAYSPADHLAAVLACGARYIHTLAWTGLSVEPAASGRLSW